MARAAFGILIRLVLAGAAVGLAWLSFDCNVTFWRATFERAPDTAALYVSLSVLAGTVKYSLAVYSEFFAVKLRTVRPLLVLFIVALVFDLLSGIGYAGLTRNEIGAEAAKIAERRATLAADIRRATDDLERIPAGRVAARVRSERDAQSRLGPCEAKRDANTDRCLRLARLDAELADADAREEAAAKLAALNSQLTDLPPPKDADPQATALAGAINAVLQILPGSLAMPAAGAKWTLALLLVLLLELGPVALARAAVAERAIPQPPPAPAPKPLPKITPAPQPANSQGPLNMASTCPPPAPRRPARPGFDLLDVIRQADAGGPCPAWLRRSADGWLYLSQADAAAAAGVSKPTIGRRLKALEASGAVQVVVTNTGTGIKLLHLAKSAA